MTHGAVVKADTALTSDSNFNGELATAVLCFVEEIDLGKGKGRSVSYNRIKDWVTAPDFQIHPKHKTPYSISTIQHTGFSVLMIIMLVLFFLVIHESL